MTTATIRKETTIPHPWGHTPVDPPTIRSGSRGGSPIGGGWAEAARAGPFGNGSFGKPARALFNSERSPSDLSRAGGANSLGGDGNLAK